MSAVRELAAVPVNLGQPKPTCSTDTRAKPEAGAWPSLTFSQALLHAQLAPLTALPCCILPHCKLSGLHSAGWQFPIDRPIVTQDTNRETGSKPDPQRQPVAPHHTVTGQPNAIANHYRTKGATPYFHFTITRSQNYFAIFYFCVKCTQK